MRRTSRSNRIRSTRGRHRVGSGVIEAYCSTNATVRRSRALVDRGGSTLRLPRRKQGLDVGRIKAVRAAAELAGYGYRALLFEYATHLVLAERAQQARDPPGTAAALEQHRCAAEQAQVASREAL